MATTTHSRASPTRPPSWRQMQGKGALASPGLPINADSTRRSNTTGTNGYKMILINELNVSRVLMRAAPRGTVRTGQLQLCLTNVLLPRTDHTVAVYSALLRCVSYIIPYAYFNLSAVIEIRLGAGGKRADSRRTESTTLTAAWDCGSVPPWADRTTLVVFSQLVLDPPLPC